jgi:acetyl-CoA carboxylase carboxyl transferase subunit alpha
MRFHLEFERSVAELENKIEELRHLTSAQDMDIVSEIQRLQAKAEKQLTQVYAKLTPWQKVQVARHPERPRFSDLAPRLVEDFTPLAGDRSFGEDRAIVGGFARYRGRPVMIMGHEKGNDTESRLRHNFGMPKPEGYRKARRFMELADHFNLPLISLVDTIGAYPGLHAEERGQAEAIARCLESSLNLKVPYVAVVVGEGGSGGAIAIAAANHVHMLEHAVYSVITPEGCASILWRSAAKAQEAAVAQKLTAQDLQGFKIIDDIITEPLGGAHRDHALAAAKIDQTLSKSLSELSHLDGLSLQKHRRDKFLNMGRTLPMN